MREHGIGISAKDLAKIQPALGYLSGEDTDNDKLPNDFEVAIGSDPHNPDSDNDGFDDYTEVLNGYDYLNPGIKKINYDLAFTKKHAGKIFLDVERNGEAWYVNPQDNKRYYLGRPADAFSLMCNLGLGITNDDLEDIDIAPSSSSGQADGQEGNKTENESGNKEENKEENKKDPQQPAKEQKGLTVVTNQVDSMQGFSRIVELTANIINSEGQEIKERGFVYTYTNIPNTPLTPTLENYQKKVIDSSLCGSATNSACNSIKANLDGLQPRTYPYIRAYVITASGEVVYGNVITINAVDKPGIPSLPSSGNGGSSSSGETGSLPPTGDENSETYTLTYTAATGTYLLDYEVNTAWQEAAAIPENLNIGYGGNAEIVDNKLYIFGGDTCDDYDQWGNCDYQWLNKILIYDLEEDSWSDGGVIPAMNESGAVQWSRSVKVGDKIYFFGGRYVEIGEDALLVRIFDTVNKTWSTSDLPNEDLYNAFPFYYNGDIYVLDMDWTFFNVYIYDPVDDEWVNASEPTVVEASTCGVDGFDFQGLVASINNNFYFFSGGDNDKFISYNVVDGSCESRDVAPLFRDSTFVFVAPPTPYDNKLFTIVYKEEEPEPGEYDVNYFPVYYDLIAHRWQKLNSPYFYNDIKYEGNLDLPYLTTFDDKLIVVSGEVNTGEDDFISRQNSYLDLASFLFKKEYSVEVKQGESGPTIYAHPEAYFTGWSDGESANPRQDLNVQGDINVNSTFNLPELTLTYTMGLPIEPQFDHIQANLVIGEPSDWEVNEPLPYEGLANLISGVVDDKIYIFGGQLSPEQSTTTAYVYDTTLDSYEELSVTNPDNAFTYRASSSEISLGNKIYSIGGLNATGQRTASSSVFDTETNTWSAIASPTYATDNAPIEVYEGEIYLFNGLENVIEIYNPDTDTWRLSTTTPLDDFSGIYDVELVDGVFYLQGVSSSTPANGYFATFNPATDTWDMRHSGLSGGRSRQYNSFHNDQGIIMYLNMIGADGSLAEAMAVYDTTDCPGDGCWQDPDNQYSWSLFPKFSLADLEAFDFYVIGDYLYVIGGQDATGVINTNRKMPMSNFPVNTYTTTVFYGQAGPKIYFDYLELGWMDHEYNDQWFLNFSDNLMEQDINIGENFIQNINIQEDINVKLWISLQPC